METIRDVFALLYLFLAALTLAHGAALVRIADRPIRVSISILLGLGILYGLFRLAAWLVVKIVGIRPLAWVLDRPWWSRLGRLAGALIVVVSLVPPLFAPDPEPEAPPERRPRPAPPTSS